MPISPGQIVLPGNYSPDSRLQAIAIGYVPGEDDGEELIHELVFPTVNLNGKKDYEYQKYRIADAFDVPSTEVSRLGTVNRVEFGYDIVTSSTKDYGLEDAIPKKEYEDSNGVTTGPVGEQLMRLVKMDREQRAARIAFNPNTYSPSQVVALSGTSKFTDKLNSDPISVIASALDGMLATANTMIMGRSAATALLTHPQIVASYQASSGLGSKQGGIIPSSYLTILFPQIKKVGIGAAFINAGSANRGSVNLRRVWGNNIALLRNETVKLPYSRTFGFTPYTGAVSGVYFDKSVGLEGGYVVRMGEQLEEVVAEPAYGYLIQNVA